MNELERSWQILPEDSRLVHPGPVLEAGRWGVPAVHVPGTAEVASRRSFVREREDKGLIA